MSPTALRRTTLLAVVDSSCRRSIAEVNRAGGERGLRGTHFVLSHLRPECDYSVKWNFLIAAVGLIGVLVTVTSTSFFTIS